MRCYQQEIGFHKNNLGVVGNYFLGNILGCGKPLVEHLCGGKFLVERGALEELLVGAGANDLSLFHDDDLVGVNDC